MSANVNTTNTDMSNFYLITACSSTRVIQPRVRVENMPKGLTMRAALDWWMSELQKHTPEITAREQYRGLGFSTLVKIQEQFKLNGVSVITGGLGLTSLNQMIVPYDFSASPKEEYNIQQHVTAEPFVQTLWWSMINEARGRGKNPIAAMVQENPDLVVVISANKVFLRYISEDVLSLGSVDQKRVKILIAASSVGSVPQQLRPMMMPFPRSAVNHIPGNRNDGAHRAAMMALQAFEKDPYLLAKGSAEAAREIFGEPNEPATYNSIGREQILKILDDNPDLLKLDPETAYKHIRREHGSAGGRIMFKGIFRSRGGGGFKPVTVQAVDQQGALDALEGLDFMEGPSQKSTEESALIGVATFVEAVRTKNPSAVFTTSNVVAWAEKFFGNKEEEVPDHLKSPNKLFYLLEAYSESLGIKSVTTQSGKGFSVVMPT